MFQSSGLLLQPKKINEFPWGKSSWARRGAAGELTHLQPSKHQNERPLILTMLLPCSQHLNSLLKNLKTVWAEARLPAITHPAALAHSSLMASPLHPEKTLVTDVVRSDMCPYGIFERGSRCVRRECFPLCTAVSLGPH